MTGPLITSSEARRGERSNNGSIETLRRKPVHRFPQAERKAEEKRPIQQIKEDTDLLNWLGLIEWLLGASGGVLVDIS